MFCLILCSEIQEIAQLDKENGKEEESSKQEVVKKFDTVEKDTLTEEVEDPTTTANVH
jgi:hypothetical protein